MDNKLLGRCDKQIENEKALRIILEYDSESSIKVGSLLYTALDLSVNDDKIYDAKKILENKNAFFSNFRGALLSLLLLRMSSNDDPEAYIDSLIGSYDKLEKGTGVSGLFTVLSAVIITEQHGDLAIDDVIAQVIELFVGIKKLHTERPNDSELAYVALMYLSGKADEQLEKEKEEIYASLKERLRLPDDAARATALVLMTNSNSIGAKTDGFVDFYEQLSSTGHATGKNQYISVYGAFADLTFLEKLGIPQKDVITAIAEVDDYLKRKPGYGMFAISKDMRKVIAAALTLQHFTIEVPRDANADFNPDISVEMLLFIVLMGLVSMN